MTAKPSAPQNNTKRNIIIASISLTAGWALFAGAGNMISSISCLISSPECSQGLQLAQVIVFTPVFVGGIMLPFGILYDQKLSWLIKLPYIVTGAIISYFVCFWLFVYALIAANGFGA